MANLGIEINNYVNFNVITKDIHTPVGQTVKGVTATLPAGTILTLDADGKWILTVNAHIPAGVAGGVVSPRLGVLKREETFVAGISEYSVAILCLGEASRHYVDIANVTLTNKVHLDYHLNKNGLFLA